MALLDVHLSPLHMGADWTDDDVKTASISDLWTSQSFDLIQSCVIMRPLSKEYVLIIVSIYNRDCRLLGCDNCWSSGSSMAIHTRATFLRWVCVRRVRTAVHAGVQWVCICGVHPAVHAWHLNSKIWHPARNWLFHPK